MAIEMSKPLTNPGEDENVQKNAQDQNPSTETDIGRVADHQHRRTWKMTHSHLSASLPVAEHKAPESQETREQLEAKTAKAYIDGEISKHEALVLLNTDQRTFEDLLNSHGFPATRTWSEEDIRSLEQ